MSLQPAGTGGWYVERSGEGESGGAHTRQNAHTRTKKRSIGVVVKRPEQLLCLFELAFGLANGLTDLLQRFGVVGLVARARLVLTRAKVLDFFARVLDLGQAESGGGALEEVAELR